MHFKWKHKLCLCFFPNFRQNTVVFFDISLFIFCSHFFLAKNVCFHPIWKVCLTALLLHCSFVSYLHTIHFQFLTIKVSLTCIDRFNTNHSKDQICNLLHKLVALLCDKYIAIK